MFYGIALIVLSILAVPSLLLAKKPDAKELLAKIAPYQGWIGLVFFVYGIYGVVFAGILNLGWLANWPIYWVTLLAGNIMQTILGFILGFGTISTYILSKNEEAKKKGAELLAKLAPIQGKLGIIGIAVGVWTIIASFLNM
ncbi:hypothetical protein [Leptospira yasudae]|uniref:hypothetical protein n=1 Tax=Leptospira yasudae TaxID=2202201 RepID=UPI0010918639|nr:hypothetical protein [Leptospira yasudae]MBW0432185.1 hypothetical protein [Leptospira yasudae]TGN02518.1 hypothetical protein EHR10_00895 [Leptospira yasudae]